MPDFAPHSKEKHAWRRHYTNLTQNFLAAHERGGMLLTPREAGIKASARIREQWTLRFPAEPVPSWMP